MVFPGEVFVAVGGRDASAYIGVVGEDGAVDSGGVAEAAGRNMKIDLLANDLDQVLDKLAKKYGNAPSACDRHVEKMAAHPESFLWLIADKGGLERAEAILSNLPEIQNAPWNFTFLETRQRTGKMDVKEIFEKTPVLDPANRKKPQSPHTKMEG